MALFRLGRTTIKDLELERAPEMTIGSIPTSIPTTTPPDDSSGMTALAGATGPLSWPRLGYSGTGSNAA